MSELQTKASNAIVAAVDFYATALAEQIRAAEQKDALVRQLGDEIRRRSEASTPHVQHIERLQSAGRILINATNVVVDEAWPGGRRPPRGLSRAAIDSLVAAVREMYAALRATDHRDPMVPT